MKGVELTEFGVVESVDCPTTHPVRPGLIGLGLPVGDLTQMLANVRRGPVGSRDDDPQH